MKSAYGTTVFCDDIREEVSGKRTYVGVYGTELLNQGPFPLVLPTFALAISFLEPIGPKFDDVNMKIFVPGDNGPQVVIDMELPKDRHEDRDFDKADPSAEYAGSLFLFKVSPLVLSSEGFIRVRAYIGDREIRLGSLKIQASEQPAEN